ncbi:hypothetical protein JCM11251_005405 [Rhodosporidiobolus azoricus]
MVKPMHEQDPRVKLLTVLNVQSAKPSKKRSSSSSSSTTSRDWHALARKAGTSTAKLGGKAKEVRKRFEEQLDDAADLVEGQEQEQEEKSNKRRKVESGGNKKGKQVQVEADGKDDDSSDDDEAATADETKHKDSFSLHFSALSNPLLPDSLPADALTALLEAGKSSAEEGGKNAAGYWKKEKVRRVGDGGAVGEAVVFAPRDLEGVERKEVEGDGLGVYNPKLLDKLRTLASKEGKTTDHSLSWLRLLSSYRDVFYPRLELGEKHDEIRQAASLHAMNHVLKTRTRILKNNDYLSRLASNPSSSTTTSPPRNTQDQSFTRPKVLILAPFRSSALSWMQHLITFLPPSITSVESYPRFVAEYSLPEGAVDKLVEQRENYPADHVETFRGNVDDAFRVGVKVTRKSARVFSNFYDSDILVASPLGLRTSIEKDGDADFLSSIEMVIVDQMDVMEMQNWEHVQFVMSRLNLMPESDHGCDFSRVKPWYLDGKAAHLRQTLLLSRFLTPESQSLFTHSLLNRAGKVKALPLLPEGGVLDKVPRGVRQVWTRFEAGEVWEEEERRFEWFTQKTLPTLLRSAVASSQTLLFVPSYFDFLRLKRYLTTATNLPADFSFAAISEYTDTPDVSRARGAFVSGKVKWLVVTERFHFYKRYRLRGAKTFVFYAPPVHPSYYPELLSFPFVPPSSLSNPSAADFAATGLEGDVDESDLSAQVLFSKWDLLRLERVVGKEDARRMVREGMEGAGEGGKRFTFL